MQQQMMRRQPAPRGLGGRTPREPEKAPLVWGVISDEAVANIVRYGVTGAVVVGGFLAAGLSVPDAIAAPRAAVTALAKWSQDK